MIPDQLKGIDVVAAASVRQKFLSLLSVNLALVSSQLITSTKCLHTLVQRNVNFPICDIHIARFER
jgi:hypothetical protein